MIDPYDGRQAEPALGCVVERDRGSLPFALIHGESLVACASWALGDSGVTLVDYSTSWDGIRGADEPFVLHDVLCPMTPSEFIADCVVRSVASDVVVVGCQPMGDANGRNIASPIVLPARVVQALEDLPSYDFSELVEALSRRFTVEYVEAPAQGRRISSEADLPSLAALTLG